MSNSINFDSLPTTKISDVVSLNELRAALEMEGTSAFDNRRDKWPEVPFLADRCRKHLNFQLMNMHAVIALINWLHSDFGLTFAQAKYLPLHIAKQMLMEHEKAAQTQLSPTQKSKLDTELETVKPGEPTPNKSPIIEDSLDISQDEHAILDELIAQQATGENRRMAKKDIQDLVNKKVGQRKFSLMLKSLADQGFLDVKQGSKGGYFITMRGQGLHRKYQESKRRKP